jgi:hypothetical protein
MVVLSVRSMVMLVVVLRGRGCLTERSELMGHARQETIEHGQHG